MPDILVPPSPVPIVITFPHVTGAPTMRHLMAKVCAAAGVEAFEVMSGSRTADLVRPRQVLCWIAHRRIGRSLPFIAHFIRRDHTTVLHAVKRVDRAIKEGDGRYVDIIEAMKGDA